MCVAKSSSKNSAPPAGVAQLAKHVVSIKSVVKSTQRHHPPSLFLKPKYKTTFNDSSFKLHSGISVLIPRFESKLSPFDIQPPEPLLLRKDNTFTPSVLLTPVSKPSCFVPSAPRVSQNSPTFPDDNLIMPEEILLPVLA